MKKVWILLVLIVVAVGGYLLTISSQPTDSGSGDQLVRQDSKQSGKSTDKAAESSNTVSTQSPGSRPGTTNASEDEEDDDFDEDEFYDERKATEVYSSAEEALEAVKKGSVEYDDIILDQFTELGEACSWCDSFYSSIQQLTFDKKTDADQRSYYAEVLAISGRRDNIELLVDQMKRSDISEEDKDIYAEALELSYGGDDVVMYLKDQLSTDDELLKETMVAAITNQSSRLAAEVLYNQALESGDPDGYYSLGIGLGELVPDDDALPYLQELAQQRDDYSHLAVKALLNQGTEGLRIVFDVLTNSDDPQGDKQKLLRDALDHVAYEEDAEEFLKQVAATTDQPLLKEFSQQILEDFALDYDDYDDEEPEDGDDAAQ